MTPPRPPRPPRGRRPTNPRSGGGGVPQSDRSHRHKAEGPKPEGLGGEQVEGRQAVRELLVAGRRRIRDVWIAEGVEETAVIAEIRQLALENRVAVRSVARTRLDAAARTDAPQGVLAHAAPLPEVDLEALTRRRDGGAPFLVVLDGVTDPHNLGAVLRTAECAGVTGVVLPRHRSCRVTPTAAKAAAGAIEYLPMAVVGGIPAALQILKDAGVWTVGLDADAGDTVFTLAVAVEPVALVLGAEGRGLSRLARDRCDVLVKIPQKGTIASLNVAAAAAVACFEIARRRGMDQTD